VKKSLGNVKKRVCGYILKSRKFRMVEIKRTSVSHEPERGRGLEGKAMIDARPLTRVQVLTPVLNALELCSLSLCAHVCVCVCVCVRVYILSTRVVLHLLTLYLSQNTDVTGHAIKPLIFQVRSRDWED
jgi:hypothetical protein